MPIRVKSAAPATVRPGSQKAAGISLCMIVKNEERFLERCLASAADAVDEINIVDTGSTDRTIEIATRFGARIERREWRDDFAWARNEALKMASKRWILQLDADEELLEESKAALRELKHKPAMLTGLWVRCYNRSDQYRGVQSESHSHEIVRVFPNNNRIRYYGPVHEFPSLDGASSTLGAAKSAIKIVHHGYLGDVVAERSKFERNMALIRKAIDHDPNDAFNWYNLGVTAFLNKDADLAIESLLRMLEIANTRGMRAFVPNGLQVLSEALTEVKSKPEEGLKYALEALRIAPKYSNAHFAAGKALCALERYDEAREMYREAISDGPYVEKQVVVDRDVPIWKAQSEIGGTFVAQGDYETAIHWYHEGLKNSPRVEPLRLNLAVALEKVGRVGEAEAIFRQVYAEFGDDQSALHLVNFLLRQNQEREALEIVERNYASFKPEIAVAMLVAAAAVMQRCGWGDGEQYLAAAREIQPEAPDVVALLTQLHQARSQQGIANKDFVTALAAAERGLSLIPNDAGLHYNAAIACINLGDKGRALWHLEHIDESCAEAYDRAEYLRAVLLRELARYDDALKSLERLHTHNGPQLDASLLRASILEAMERTHEAEAEFVAALSLGRQRAAVELASFYLRAGRFGDAKRVAEEALA
jgi:tetratricopeptide (TPR) repeat protein